MRHRSSGITLVEVAAGVTVLAVVLSLLVPALSHGSRVEKLLACQAHLVTLYQAQLRGPAPGPRDFGKVYWTRLLATQPPLIGADALKCPFVESPDAPACHYLGPAEILAKGDSKTPMGSDMELNHSEDGHEGGNVLLKSGEVETDHTGIWISAVRQGKCRP